MLLDQPKLVGLSDALELCVGRSHIHLHELEPWSHDGTELSMLPDVVVEPSSTAEVVEIVRLAASNKVPLVTRGAGSGLAGGAVPQRGGIVLSMARMNRILEIDAAAMTVSAEAGVITGDLQAAVEAQGLFYPPDPASLSICSIGGNVACNAGGPRAVKYGVTRNYVLGLTVVLASGEILKLGSKTHKQASGYGLLHLFVGSEGTLGVIAEVTLRLLPKPPARATLNALFPTLLAASAAVTSVLHHGSLPCTIELLDHTVLTAIEAHLHLGLAPQAQAMLLIEQDGLHLPALADELAAVRSVCEEHGGFGVEIATEQQERDRLWLARRSIYFALKALAPNLRNEDIVVPRSVIPEMVERIKAIGAETGLQIAAFGHAGDGNLHPSILFDGSDPGQRLAVERAEAAIVRATIALGGMVSGEHGVGLMKRAYLEDAVGSGAVAMMMQLKRSLDPHNILNPGKIFEREE